MKKLSDILLRVKSEFRESLRYLNDHKIVRAYRAMERAKEEIDHAIALEKTWEDDGE